MIYPLVQGIVAGGTAAYLRGRLEQEVQENTSKAWMTTALQVNHLLLLIAENVFFAKAPLGMLGSLVRTAPTLGVVAAGLSIHHKDRGVSFSAQKIRQISAAYQVGVIATSCATFALGNPVFAVASLSMIVTDAIVSGKAKKVFDVTKKITAFCAAAGYGMQILSSTKISALMAQVSTILTGGKLFLDWLPEKEDLASVPSDVKAPVIKHSHYSESRWGYLRMPQINNFPSLGGSLENLFCRASVW